MKRMQGDWQLLTCLEAYRLHHACCGVWRVPLSGQATHCIASRRQACNTCGYTPASSLRNLQAETYLSNNSFVLDWIQRAGGIDHPPTNTEQRCTAMRNVHLQTAQQLPLYSPPAQVLALTPCMPSVSIDAMYATPLVFPGKCLYCSGNARDWTGEA